MVIEEVEALETMKAWEGFSRVQRKCWKDQGVRARKQLFPVGKWNAGTCKGRIIALSQISVFLRFVSICVSEFCRLKFSL